MDAHEQINELLAAYALGELPGQEASKVRGHLDKCEQCRDELSRMEAVLGVAEGMRALSANEQTCESAKEAVLAVANKETTVGVAKATAALELIRRTIMSDKRFRFAGAAAVVLAGILAGVYLLDNGTSGRAFGAVIKNVIKAESISFVQRAKIGTGPAVRFRIYIQGSRMRGDMVGLEGEHEGLDKLQKEMRDKKLNALMSYVVDFEQKEGIELDHYGKTCKRISVDDRMVQEFAKSNIPERFRNVTQEDAEWIRQEQQNGRKIDVYLVRRVDLMGIEAELSGEEGERMTVWVDRVSKLPVRILLEASAHVEGKSKDWFEFCDFVWNEELEAELFVTEPPAGYEVQAETPGPHQVIVE